VFLLVMATGCGGDRDVVSSPTTTSPVPAAPTSTAAVEVVPTGPELDAETARTRGLASLGPDLATVASTEAGVGGSVVVDLAASDPDSPCPTLRFDADGLPEGLTVTSPGDCTARVLGTVRAPAGRYVVTYRVTDDTGAADVSVALIEVHP
jgi:hypothetical protein